MINAFRGHFVDIFSISWKKNRPNTNVTKKYVIPKSQRLFQDKGALKIISEYDQDIKL